MNFVQSTQFTMQSRRRLASNCVTALGHGDREIE